jgi:hypothetical protein
MKYALISSNPFKAEEFQDSLGRYGHTVTRIEPQETDVSKATVLSLLQGGFKVVFAEESKLVHGTDGGGVITTLQDAAIVYNVSTLHAWFLDLECQMNVVEYVSDVKGFIDLSLANADDPKVFGWDDVFVPLLVGDDFHTLKGRNLKNSARQMNLGKFSVDNLFYDKRLDLNFSPIGQEDTVDFSGVAISFLRNDPILQAGVCGSPLQNVLSKVVQSGVFFRSAKNRREKNYWLPGLNSGIPLTAKKDKVHEITFMFHDLMHFQFPDLVFDQHSALGQKVYLLHRMMGEAITLVLADMVFVDNLRKAGIEYDWSKRKIHPLLEALNLNSLSTNDLRTLLHANMRYALFGDDSEFRARLKPEPEALVALEGYKAKYSRFFAEDWRWTASNYENMREQEASTSEWVKVTAGEEAFFEIGVPLLSRFATSLNVTPDAPDQVIADAIFDHLIDQVLIPNMLEPVDIDVDVAASNAFKRYLVGQLSLFTRYRDLLSGKSIAEKLRKIIMSGKTLSATEIVSARALFTHYVDELIARDIISSDDGAMFAVMHPVFKPFYVFYDAQKATELKDCSELYLAA